MEYIDTLTLGQVEEYRDFDTVLEGIRKASAYLRKKEETHRPKGVKVK